MEDMDRRSALGLAAAATSALVLPAPATAQTYGPNEGKELMPGVRQVDLGKRETMIKGYKTVSMRDIVFQPGTSIPEAPMRNDMLCHITEGELHVKQAGKEFTVKKNGLYSCAQGEPEQPTNTGSTVAIMRIIDLLPA